MGTRTPGRLAALAVVGGLLAGALSPAAAQEPPPSVRIESVEAPAVSGSCAEPPIPTIAPGSFTLVRTGPTTEPLVVDYTVTGDVATPGGTVEFLSGAAIVSAPLVLLPSYDDLAITIELVDGDAYDLGDPSIETFFASITMPICVGPPDPPEPPEPRVVEPRFAG